MNALIYEAAVRCERLREIIDRLPDGHRWYEALAQALHEAQMEHSKLLGESLYDYEENDDE